MDMRGPRSSRLSDVRDWCHEQEFHPSRALGQNFLTDGNLCGVIVNAAECREGMRVLEIGPGLGALTEKLLEAGVRVTAVEKDARLCGALRLRLPEHPALELIEADALEIDLDKLLERGFDRMVSNLPYSIGTRLLMDLVRHVAAPPLMIVMVQQEVARRLAAPEGDSHRGLASVWPQRCFDVRIVRAIPPACFWPKPEVASSVVVLRRHARHPLDKNVASMFEVLTRASFAHRRKTLQAALRSASPPVGAAPDVLRRRIAQTGIAEDARPQTLTLAQWCSLAQRWCDDAGPSCPASAGDKPNAPLLR